MEPAKSFKDLIVRQKAHELVLGIYRLTMKFPKEELYGLISQMRRASVSIPANIVVGFKKRGIKDKVRFLSIAEGSLEELKYYLILTSDLEYASTDQFNQPVDEIGKLLTSYSKALFKNSIS